MPGFLQRDRVLAVEPGKHAAKDVIVGEEHTAYLLESEDDAYNLCLAKRDTFAGSGHEVNWVGSGWYVAVTEEDYFRGEAYPVFTLYPLDHYVKMKRDEARELLADVRLFRMTIKTK